ncbi:MAG: hypothetical protein H5T64_06425 [Chloroflexi bacterium]|nr:hypothetical protein [Chloroflexota bacterium]
MTHRPKIAISVLFALACWSGIAYFTYTQPPEGLNVLLVLIVFCLGLLFSSLPVLFYLGRWLRPHASTERLLGNAIRRSTLFAMFLTVGIGLHILHALNWVNASLLFAIAFLLEILLGAYQNNAP